MNGEANRAESNTKHRDLQVKFLLGTTSEETLMELVLQGRTTEIVTVSTLVTPVLTVIVPITIDSLPITIRIEPIMMKIVAITTDIAPNHPGITSIFL